MTTGGRVDGRTAAGYLFHTAHITETIQGCRRVVDLGCGTAVQLLQVAELNPRVHFLGLDRSSAMLQVAQATAAAAGLPNVAFERADITSLVNLADASVDGVICTMTLHHLAGVGELNACLLEMKRVLKPGGAVYIEDFGRLKAARSVDYFVSRGAAAEKDAFSKLYASSLRAAFLAGELRTSVARCLPAAVRAYSTFPLPFLMVFKTHARGLTPQQTAQLRQLSTGLTPNQRKDLLDLSKFFRWGGMRGYAFA